MKVKTHVRPRQDRAPDGVRAAGHRSARPRTTAHDPHSKFWSWADRMGIDVGRFPERDKTPRPTAAIRPWRSISMPASSAISASAPAAKCRSTTSSAWPAAATAKRSCSTSTTRWAQSTCVACGECVQACPTGALMPATLVDDKQRAHRISRPRGAQRVPLLRRRLPAHLSHQGRQALVCDRPQRPGQPEPAVREGPLRLRLRQQSAAPDQADGPQGRRGESRRRSGRSGQSVDAFPRGDLGRGDGARRFRPEENPRPRRSACAGRLRLGQRLERRGLSVPEAGAHRLRHQQCRPLHAALPRLVGGGAAGRRRLRGGDRDLQRVQEFRRHHRDRRQPDRKPPGRRHLLQAGGQARRQAGRDGSARAGA